MDELVAALKGVGDSPVVTASRAHNGCTSFVAVYGRR